MLLHVNVKMTVVVTVVFPLVLVVSVDQCNTIDKLKTNSTTASFTLIITKVEM